MLCVYAWITVAICITSVFIPPIVLFVPVFVIITIGLYRSLRKDLERDRRLHTADSRRSYICNSVGKITSHESEML